MASSPSFHKSIVHVIVLALENLSWDEIWLENMNQVAENQLYI